MSTEALKKEAKLAQKLAQQPKKHFRGFPKKNTHSLRQTQFSKNLPRLSSHGAELFFNDPAKNTSAETGLSNW